MIGFPIAQPLPEQGDIKPCYIPASKRIFCMYRDPYGEMEPIYNEMFQWIADHGYTATGASYEYYYNGPEFPQSESLTMVVMPLS